MDKRIVITGADGLLGKLCIKHFQSQQGCEVVQMRRKTINLADEKHIRRAMAKAGDYDVIINCAAMTNVDGCEDDPEAAHQINGDAVGVLGEIAAEDGAQVIHISTDYVFDGEKDGPYTEDDETNPISVYGASKLAGEQLLFESFPDHLVVRVAWLYGPGKQGFPEWVIRQALEKDELSIVSDKSGSPTYAPDLLQALESFVFCEEPYYGVVHFSNSGECSWLEWAQHCIDCAADAGLPIKAKKLGEQSMADLAKLANWKAKRPQNSVFSTEKFTTATGQTPRDWKEAVAEYVTEHLATELA
ncbi:MAG: dTDP-4-dehydrorhamnose reductase [Verrucomicrobiales bacterium]|jgi:dTDP-4-dehydrorhamnose reductase